MAEPAPLWCVGSYDEEGKPNVMAAAWGGICCSKPPCVTVSIQKIRHSYDAIVKRKAFTVSVPSAQYAKDADYFGVASGKDVNKFEKTGLTAVKSDLVDAPYVKEFPLVLECKILHIYDAGLHTMFIGEIMDVKADEEILNDKGRIDTQKLKPITYSPGARLYYTVGDCLGPGFQIGKDF